MAAPVFNDQIFGVVTGLGSSYGGWNDYERMKRMAAVNPNPAFRNNVENRDMEFNVAAAAVPYTNTPARASSTFVRNIRYLPSSRTAFVRLGNSTYWYGMSPTQLAQWLTSNSLGRYYNNYLKMR